MPRLVRRRSLGERIRDYLNPHDWLLWVSEELESSDYPWDEWAYIIGAVFNLVFIISRANASAKVDNDVFADEMSSGGLFGPLASLLAFLLTILSFTNAIYTFMRRRHYRLFETPVEGKPPNTPSAHRVRVDSSPASSSPLKFLKNLIESDSASSRAHPDATRDVWEISVWDPAALNLKLFCAFSPGHVILYYLFLPISLSDPQPSVTVATAIGLAGLLSLQLSFLQSNFSQQSKDTSIVQKEVMHEYDTKFVHPLTQPTMRDVGTQFDDEEHTFNSCEVYTPAVVINRGFRTHANPNYAKYVDPDGANTQQISSNFSQPPNRVNVLRNPDTRESISPSQRALSGKQGATYRSSGAGTPDMGHLGVYSNARSPLKRSSAVQPAAGRDAWQSSASARLSNQAPSSKRSSYVASGPGVAKARLYS